MNVAIIPARGNSVRVPRKNIRTFHGKPVMAYAIDAAINSGAFDAVYVSTEDVEIAQIAHRHGALVSVRPEHLAEIGAPDFGTQAVTAHALTKLKCDYACCIYPCTPMLTADDLLTGFSLLRAGDYRYTYIEGQFYWGKRDDFIWHPELDNALRMKSSARHIDINTEDDWKRAEEMYTVLHAAH